MFVMWKLVAAMSWILSHCNVVGARGPMERMASLLHWVFWLGGENFLSPYFVVNQANYGGATLLIFLEQWNLVDDNVKTPCIYPP